MAANARASTSNPGLPHAPEVDEIVQRPQAAPGAGKTPLRYVLSAGRTGTVFLENLINTHVAGARAVHEPRETRYQMMLANLRNETGLAGRFLASRFGRAREARIAAGGDRYVEINPFLCPMTDLLPHPARDLRVVHMVRDPANWARSISTFKASEGLRGIIDFVPFAKPYPAPRPSGWRSMDEYTRALYRWTWCNEKILALRPHCTAYALVRYEDVFTGDAAVRDAALRNAFATLHLPFPDTVTAEEMARRANPAPTSAPGTADPRVSSSGEEAVAAICGTLARQFGYAY